MDLCHMGREIAEHCAATKRLAERVDYLNVAVMRGDPRFARPEFTKPDFDCAAFDAQWAGRGKRVPPFSEVFG